MARSQAVMSPSARVLSNRASGALVPKIRVWVQKNTEAPVPHEFQQTEIVLGRTPDCGIVLSSSNISRRHAQILYHDSFYWLMDLGSSNGVFSNHTKVEKIKLSPGLKALMGEFTLWIEFI